MPRPCSALIGHGSPRPSDEQLPHQLLAALVVDLVRTTQHRAVVSCAAAGDRRVVVGDPDGGVDDEHDDIGVGDGLLGPGGDLLVEVRASRHPSAGVDEREGAALPLGVDLFPVAGDARQLLTIAS